MDRSIVLASGSPRRRDLLAEHGYRFRVEVPDDSAESGLCGAEAPDRFAIRMARQKAENVARRHASGLFLGCDTIVVCGGAILGKPRDEADARRILTLLRGREHDVISGVCLWQRPEDRVVTACDVTRLVMDDVTDAQLDDYLLTDLWCGKAGAFGYQDGLDWVHVVRGSESNVVGLPMELLARLLSETDAP
ncbi:MAG TPA: nucleoside triphosphate pyrophosphatase [Pirellulaceae bacterium]|nr:nucleoside triphosphate pyrophosphatase [Pirellulaceae bacterium]